MEVIPITQTYEDGSFFIKRDRTKESLLARFIRYRDLALALAMRDVRMRYQLSILGLYWALLNPLFMALIWSFVFKTIFRAAGMEGVPYVVFLFSGLTFWNFFANSLATASNCLTGNASLLSKLYFPRVILPTASVLARLVDFGFSLIVLVIFMIAYRIMPGGSLVYLPILLVIQLFFTLGMAYIVAALNVLYRDINQIVTVLLLLLLYLSPIFYTVSQIPESLAKYYIFNVVGELVGMETGVLFGKLAIQWQVVGMYALVSTAVFLFGLFVFHRIEPLFAEVM
jgi:ABC-type polysaccharide/polyol phosphate export permease